MNIIMENVMKGRKTSMRIYNRWSYPRIGSGGAFLKEADEWDTQSLGLGDCLWELGEDSQVSAEQLVDG